MKGFFKRNNLQGEEIEFKKNPHQAKYVQYFLKFVYLERLGMAEAEGARLAANISNVFMQKGSVGMVCRTITTIIPSVEELRLPEILKKLKPTVRIVSYRFCIRGMTPGKVSADKTLFLYQLTKGTEINNYT